MSDIDNVSTRPLTAENPQPVRHCGQWVPDRLRGNLDISKCRLMVGADGTHTGLHKAQLTVPGVGKVIWRWN